MNPDKINFAISFCSCYCCCCGCGDCLLAFAVAYSPRRLVLAFYSLSFSSPFFCSVSASPFPSSPWNQSINLPQTTLLCLAFGIPLTRSSASHYCDRCYHHQANQTHQSHSPTSSSTYLVLHQNITTNTTTTTSYLTPLRLFLLRFFAVLFPRLISTSTASCAITDRHRAITRTTCSTCMVDQPAQALKRLLDRLTPPRNHGSKGPREHA